MKLPRGRMYGWTCMQTSQSSDTVPPHSCHFLGQSHTQRNSYPLFQWRKECVMCVFVLCIPLSITTAKGQATAVDTSPFSSPPDLLQSLPLFFQTRLPWAGGERERGYAPERGGMEGWKKEKKGGGSEGSFVRSSSCILVLL